MDEENRIVVRNKRFNKSFSLRRGDRAICYEYVNDFNNTFLKRCKKLDKQNSHLYDKNIKLYNSIMSKMEKNNALFEITNPPEGPRTPTNEECFNIHQMRNKEVNNKLQTMALTYLTMHSYELIIDPPRNKLDFIKRVDNNFFEPYMALNLARKVSSERGENFIQIIKEKYRIINEHSEILVNKPGNNGEDFEQVSAQQRSNIGNRYREKRHVTNLDGLKHRQNIYPSINEHGEDASHPQPSAPPPLPMPNSPNHMYPMSMENSNMFHKHLSEFGNDLNNLDTESVISEPPSYSGVINGGSSHRSPSKPDRKKKGVSIVINNQ